MSKQTDFDNKEPSKDPEILKKSKLAFSVRLAGAAAMVGAFVYVAAKAGVAAGRAVLAGDFSGIVGAAKTTAKLAFQAAVAIDPINRFRKGKDISVNHSDKFRNETDVKEKPVKERPKWQDLSAGQKVKRVGGLVRDTLFSKAAKRTYKSTAIIVSVAAVNPTPIGLGIAAVSSTAIVYDVAKETLERRNEKRKETEKDTLQNIKDSKDHQMILLSGNALNVAAEKNPAVKEFIQDTSKSVYAQAETHVPYVPIKPNRAVAFAKVLGNQVVEGAALIAKTANAGMTNTLLGIAALTGKIREETDDKLEKIERNHILDNKIKNLQWVAEPYKNREELKELDRQEKVATEALKRVTEDPSKLENLSKVQIDAKLAVMQKQVDQEPEFVKPAEKTRIDKVKAGTKELSDAFVEAQFGDLKKAYGLNKDDKPHFEPSTINPEKPNKEPVLSLSQKKAHEMQEHFSQNQATAYKSSIAAPSETPHKEHHSSSRGV